MKTKKFLMTTLLVMGMVIAKAANGFPPELVLVSQPVLTYNANSVTVYYDVQNIGDYSYRGNIYIYLDPDDGYYYAKKWVRVCPGRIKRVAITIPAYRPNPSWVYTVMPYYELGNELYSFTVFEYFEPVTFHWYGYRNEPWVVINVGPRPRHYHRPYPYRFYYDGFRPYMPPPPGGYPPGYFDRIPPMNPMHHTYGYHHHYGGYPANYYPDHEVPGYNHNPGNGHNNGGGHNEAPSASVRPSSSVNNHSMSGTESNITPSNNNNSSMSGRSDTNTGRTGNGESGRSDNSSDSGRTGNGDSGRSDSGSVRPSSSATSSSSGRTGNGDSGRSSSSSTGRSDSNSGRSGSSSSTSRSDSNSGRSDSGTVSRSDSGRSSGSSSSSSSSSSGRSGSSSGRSDSSRSASSSSSSSRSSASSSSRSASSSSRSSGGSSRTR